jgi:outer membrane protein TolC
VENASKGYLPQLTIYGQATYQSDVTKIPIKLPGADIPVLSKDQYRMYVEATQVIYDGGMIRQQKALLETNGKIEEQRLEVELYKLKDRINQLFFGILLTGEQLKQNALLQDDIQRAIHKAQALAENGTALKSSVAMLQAELIKAKQRSIELQAAHQAYKDMLGLFISAPLDERTQLLKPQSMQPSEELKRPELFVYDTQEKGLDVQKSILLAKNRPRLSFFAQGGYGRPALNVLSNTFDPYYIGGLRFNFPLSGLYTLHKEKALIEINRKSIAVQKETFLFNIQFGLKQQQAEINKLQEILQSDEEMITLRNTIKNTVSAQLENGIVQASDYLRELNADDNARQNKILHEIQLLIAQYNQQNITGN